MFIRPIGQRPSNNSKVPFKATLYRDLTLLRFIENMWSPDQTKFVNALNKLELKLLSNPERDMLTIREIPAGQAKRVMVMDGYESKLERPAIGGYGGGNIFGPSRPTGAYKPEDIQLDVEGRKLGFCTNASYQTEEELFENLYKTYEYIKSS